MIVEQATRPYTCQTGKLSQAMVTLCHSESLVNDFQMTFVIPSPTKSPLLLKPSKLALR